VARPWVLVALAACTFRHGGLAPGDGGDDGPAIDAAIDAPPDTPADGTTITNCYSKWLDDTIRFGAPVALATVNSAAYDRDPFLPAGELSIYFSTGRAGTQGSDIWMATRTDASASFGPPVEASAFNSTSNETKLSIDATNKIAVVGSDRPGSSGVDVWDTVRGAATDQWPAMQRIHVMTVETSGNDHDPTLSADGLRIYLAPDNPSPQHLVVATRVTTAGNFGAPTAITQLDSGTGDSDPSPTADERILVWSSFRAATPAGRNIWYATRSSPTAIFGTPHIVPDINTDLEDGDPHVSADGCQIYFARDIGGGDWELFVATAQ
jgi:hypothetical protein